MDRETFLNRLHTEPRSDDPTFRAACRDNVEYARLAREAQAFEGRLEEALRLPVDADLADRILGALALPGRRRPRWTVVLAVAATLALAAGLMALLPGERATPPDPVVAAFVEHLRHDEPESLSMEPVALDQAIAALTQVGADPSAVPGAVTYVYPCAIGGERGLHLVMTDDERRRVTLLYLPRRSVARAGVIEAPDGASARVFDVPGGAVALVGHGNQDLDVLAEELFGSGVLRIAGPGWVEGTGP